MNNINSNCNQKQLRYVTVYNELFKMITEGEFKDDLRLPSEPFLAKSLGVSRATLRQALSLLQDDGLINNIQGKGNFIIKSNLKKSSGLYNITNPIYKCINEKIDSVEMDFHLEVPNEYMSKVLQRKTAVCIALDRWYKAKDSVVAYSFSLIPIETITENNLDLNNKEQLLNFLEKDIYLNATKSSLEVKYSTAGSFTAKKYSISSYKQFHLLQESLYSNTGNTPMIYNKHYLPIDISSIKIDLFKTPINRG